MTVITRSNIFSFSSQSFWTLTRLHPLMDFKKLKLKRTTKRWKAIDTLFGLLSRQGKLGLCWKNFFHLVFLMFIALTFVSITKCELSVWYCLTTTTTTTSTTAKFPLSLWRRCHHLWLCLVVFVLCGRDYHVKRFRKFFSAGWHSAGIYAPEYL